MGIVRFALRFPHTFYVLAALVDLTEGSRVRARPERAANAG